jgi:lambda family phage portal protein
MGLLEKFAPQWALKRAVARRRLGMVQGSGYGNHGASGKKKALVGWLAKSLSPDDDIVKNAEELRERSRDLYMGAPLATGALKTIKTNVVGAGLRLNAQPDIDVLGLTPEQAHEWERRVEAEWALWADTTMCDAARLCTFGQLQGLALLSQLMSGDAFAVLPVVPRGGQLYDTRVYIIEADRVCNPDAVDPRRDVLGGVEVDSYGAPVAYYIAKHHPYSLSVRAGSVQEWRRVPAYGRATGRRNVLHLVDLERPGQRRGVPVLAPVIESLKQITRYTDAELMAAVVSGMYTIFIKSDAPDGMLGEVLPEAEQVDADDETSIELGNGAVVGLGEGESIQEANPGRPNSGFDPFVVSICRQIGAALEIPYELLIRHFSASYSASRAALLEAWKMFRVRREALSMGFCQPVYEEWLAEAVAKGRINAPGFFGGDPLIRAAWCKAEWHGPAQGQLDPVKEATAAKIRVDEEFSTRTREAVELTGGDWQRIHRRRTEEERMRRADGTSKEVAQDAQQQTDE